MDRIEHINNESDKKRTGEDSCKEKQNKNLYEKNDSKMLNKSQKTKYIRKSG